MSRVYLAVVVVWGLSAMIMEALPAQTVISLGQSSVLYDDWANTSLTGIPWYDNNQNGILQFTVYTSFKNKQAILLNYNHCDGIYAGVDRIGYIEFRHYTNCIFNYGIPIRKHLYFFAGPSVLHKNDAIVVYLGFDPILVPVYSVVYGISSQLDYEVIPYKHLSIHAFARFQVHQNTTSIGTIGINVGYKIN